ncbi:type IV secretory system conjugative DNA transfer family protein [uncultured Roseovarius sp.]|uniref:type IV secretory system conjugative DNA transfer family protein n=1 Tax=uncultured Roseovarius sp. TaxID=293344 RepID=UPI0025D4EAF6|nr:type IV secretory system conjugative DNA transfer family protein [uncultured Roseovarius sp.]
MQPAFRHCQVGKQPLVLQSIKIIRSYGERLFIISQSIPGLEGIYEETDRRALQAGAGVQIYMLPQDDRTADVLSAALGKRTILGKTRSQATVRKLSESANISRRLEERALVSPAELLRFPLYKILVLPEGQYPIKADHIRYYADRHFAEINKARQGHALPYPPAAAPISNRPKNITLEQPESAAPTANSMGSKEFETAVQTYTEAQQGHAKAARAQPRRTPPGARKSIRLGGD